MKGLCIRFVQDDRGFVISAELVLVMTLGALSMVVGLQAVSSAITQELNDVANAFGAVSQSYSYRTIAKRRHAWISGSGFRDRADFCDCNPILQTDVVGHIGHSGHRDTWDGPEGDGPRNFDAPIHHDGRHRHGHEFGPDHGPGAGHEFHRRHEQGNDHKPHPSQLVDPKLCCPETDTTKPAEKPSTQEADSKQNLAPKLVVPGRDKNSKKKD